MNLPSGESFYVIGLNLTTKKGGQIKSNAKEQAVCKAELSLKY